MLSFSDYLSVQEAASILGASARSVYGYIAKGQLPATRIGERIFVRAQDVSTFERTAPGRQRVLAPAWHIPPQRNRQYVTMITVRVRVGQNEALEDRLGEVQGSSAHRFFGTSARYVVHDQRDPAEIALGVRGRGAVMPD